MISVGTCTVVWSELSLDVPAEWVCEVSVDRLGTFPRSSRSLIRDRAPCTAVHVLRHRLQPDEDAAARTAELVRRWFAPGEDPQATQLPFAGTIATRLIRTDGWTDGLIWTFEHGRSHFVVECFSPPYDHGEDPSFRQLAAEICSGIRITAPVMPPLAHVG